MTDRVLKITDGDLTVDFADLNSGYIVMDSNWRPATAGRRVGELGGAGPYEEVTEQMGIRVTAATKNQLNERLNTLGELMDRATRWWKGEPRDPVIFEYRPQGIGLGTFQAAILGMPSGGPTISYPNHIEETKYIGLGTLRDPIQLQFMRRGAWVWHKTKTPTL